MFDEDLIDESSLRRQIETSYLYQRRIDGCITAIFPISVIDSKVWYSVAYNRSELCSDRISFASLKKYLEIRNFADCEGKQIVNDEEIYITKKAAVVPVRSKDPEEWKKEKYHFVEIFNLPKKDATEQEKNNLLRNLIVHCSCGSPVRYIMSPYKYRYKLLSDDRIPYVNSIVDLHGNTAIMHLSLTRGFEDFEFWGYNPDPVRVTRFVVERQLKIGKRMDNDIMNSLILRHARSLFNPLERRLFLRH